MRPRVAAAFAVTCLLVGGACSGSSGTKSTVGTAGPTTSGAARGASFVTVYLTTAEVPRCRDIDELLVSGAVAEAALPASRKTSDDITDLHALAGRWTITTLSARHVLTTADVATPPVPGC